MGACDIHRNNKVQLNKVKNAKWQKARHTRCLFTSAREDIALQQRTTTKQVYVVVRQQFEPGVTAHKSIAPTDSDC